MSLQGISFRGPVQIRAGLDKDQEATSLLYRLGRRHGRVQVSAA
jgi:hypothetical protein